MSHLRLGLWLTAAPTARPLEGNMLLTTTRLLSQRAEPSPSWLETFPKRRTGGGLARILSVRCEKAMRGFASRVPGGKVSGPPFCAHGG